VRANSLAVWFKTVTIIRIKKIIPRDKRFLLQYVSNKIKPRQWISFIWGLFYWIHTVVVSIIIKTYRSCQTFKFVDCKWNQSAKRCQSKIWKSFASRTFLWLFELSEYKILKISGWECGGKCQNFRNPWLSTSLSLTVSQFLYKISANNRNQIFVLSA